MKLRTITEQDAGSARESDDEQPGVQGFVGDIEQITHDNENFREVLYTAEDCQLVVMSIEPQEDIGLEIHDVAQFFRVEEGRGKVTINGQVMDIVDGSGIVIPAGAEHNVVNTGDEPLKIYTIYCPPHHKDGTVHATRAEAKRSDEHFDGETTESSES